MNENLSDLGVVIGLCGRSGSGKTTVCKAFAESGIVSIDTDLVYREMTRPEDDGMPSELVRLIARELGGDVIAYDGTLDRAVLAAKVFGDGNENNLATLNSITHKHILEKTRDMIREYFKDGAKGVIVDAPALFESGFDSECDAIVCVVAPEEDLVHRIMERDHLSEDAARKRLSSQISAEELCERSDYVIDNRDGGDPVDAVRAAAHEILKKHSGDN